MRSNKRKCENHSDMFFYVCEEYTFKEIKQIISIFVEKAYLGYFGNRLGNQDKTWTPYQFCKTCIEYL